MCDVCHQYPCHPRCPNAPEPPAVFICSGCGEKIYEEHDYWDILGEQFCETCIEDAKKDAEYELICSVCEELIYEGEAYYHIMGRAICARCVDDARREARFEYDDDCFDF